MKALIVDDDIILQNLLTHHLNNAGVMEIHRVRSGEEAIEITQKEEFDIGFFDINLLTSLDGIDAARAIKEQKPNLQIVFISANEDSVLMERCSTIENLGFLNKPYNPELIQQYIKMVKIRLRQKNKEKGTNNPS
ncbi:MAG: hypothetical protein Fur0027_05170 [Raineya sp.]